MSKHTFILNDETKVNQYGFRVLNFGLKLERFINNPVMLDGHYAGTWSVIGRWDNIRLEGHLLLGDAVFDVEDKNANDIAGKVERGFLRGASLGLDPFTMNNFVLAPDGVYDLVESEVLEASIVAIPNNANAIKLYASGEESMKELQENEVSEILLMANDISNLNLHNNMKKIPLTLSAVVALGLPEGTLEHDAEVVSSKIIELNAKLQAAESKVEGFEKLEADKKAKLSADTVDADIKSGKIKDATKREEFIRLHAEFPSLYKTTVTEATGKTNLSAQVKDPVNISEIKSFEDFQKLELSAQLAFKEENPNEYKALFK